jgi:single-stranded-DNA-specific exonuclease
MAAACEAIRGAVAAGKPICVHGDYDADGICATALAVLTLRELGADVSWHLPSRFDEGYGISGETLTRLAGEGCGLVLSVDCGITAVEEVARAKALGLEVVVTDHHQPGERLPDCPLVVTRPSEYPFPELCGTGVVAKLAEALGVPVGEHQDLVGLATIADVVPLVDENRAFALAGLRALARTQKPGLRALMQVAHVDPAAVDAGAVGFRLAPRINAAGRLGHPREALELLLTDDADEARRLAQRLEEVNRERQAVEERILRSAVAQIEGWPENKRRRHGYALADSDWHEGVIGIVASRLVERYHRPVVLIAGREDAWKGSGRSVGTFDLHEALSACSDHLLRWGGHRAAAGLSIDPSEVDAFARAFAHADGMLSDEELAPTAPVDAIVPRGMPLTLELAQELAQLAPFGLGNPGVTLLAPACELRDLGTVGDGKHLKFRVRGENGGDAGSAIAFGLGSHLDRLRRDGRFDVSFRLEENRWNGTVAPQLVVRRVFDTDDRYGEFAAWLRAQWGAEGRDAAAQEVFDELLLESGVKRSLLESERFRALLAEPAALPAAA